MIVNRWQEQSSDFITPVWVFAAVAAIGKPMLIADGLFPTISWGMYFVQKSKLFSLVDLHYPTK